MLQVVTCITPWLHYPDLSLFVSLEPRIESPEKVVMADVLFIIAPSEACLVRKFESAFPQGKSADAGRGAAY